METRHLRNFVIISHIDHGKSTLADRLLERTGTVEMRRMRTQPQYLDQMDLERERGITIKMAPVRMHYEGRGGVPYILNLIDTPGHSDFAYEVSRALAAVEGAVLLVDVSQGIQAQTLSNLRMAQQTGLRIIGAVNKIDLNPPHIEKTIEALAGLINDVPENILRISGKTGAGIPELLEAIVERIPPPREDHVPQPRALIFDSRYDDHKGIIAYVRVMGGTFEAQEAMSLLATRTICKIKEVGFFAPELAASNALSAGEIGYIATGLKEPVLVTIGDTVSIEEKRSGASEALAGYRTPAPVVFVSFYPVGETKFEDLEESFTRLRLNDAALALERESNDALGRGLRVGFLGQLHFEITSDRLRREFGVEFLTSFPSVGYRVITGGVEHIIREPHDWPIRPDRVYQQMILTEIVVPESFMSRVLNLKGIFDIEVFEVKNMGEHMVIVARMPLYELIRDFDDQLKSVSAGYASFSYEVDGEALADVDKLEIMIAGETQPALTRIVPKKDIEREGRVSVERLKKLLPREQFAVALQAQVQGRIIARETIPALRKDVTGYLYGGDRSRKMKLWKKQKRGKEKLKGMGRVTVPVEVFRELLKK